MASPHPTAAGDRGGPRQQSLPGFAAFLRPHAQLQASTGDGARETFHGRQEHHAYLPPAPSLFASDLRRAEDRFDGDEDRRRHRNDHPHRQFHNQYQDVNSLRPPVVPAAYDSAGDSPLGTSKPRKIHAHDSPSASARAVPSQSRSSSSSSPASASVGRFQLHHDQHHRQSVRTSRYLREADRRAILERIQNGEKQADLAKEFQVSRAAISNLKQRRRLKDKQQGGASPSFGGPPSARAAPRATRSRHEREDEGGTRRRSSSGESSSPSERLTHNGDGEDDGDGDGDGDAIRAVVGLRLARRGHVRPPLSGASPTTTESPPASSTSQASVPSWTRAAASRTNNQVSPAHQSVVRGASVPLLLTQLTRRGVDGATFRVSAQRLARLLLEEMLGRLPTRSLERDDATVELAPPVCAIAVNDGRGSELLLDEFRAIEPLCGVGAVRTQPATDASTRPAATLVHAPEQLRAASVLLLDLACSETGHEICAALETLQASGVRPHRVFVATLVAHTEGAARVWDEFPQLGGLVTTKLLQPPASRGTTSDSEAADLVERLRLQLARTL